VLNPLPFIACIAVAGQFFNIVKVIKSRMSCLGHVADKEEITHACINLVSKVKKKIKPL
jgi:hypothetical protein